MAKCNKCAHKNICKHEENMRRYEAEIKEKSKLLEYQTFHSEIRCDNFLSDTETPVLNYPAGCR